MNYKVYKNDDLILETKYYCVASEYFELKKNNLCHGNVLTIKKGKTIMAEYTGTLEKERTGMQLHNADQIETLGSIRLNEVQFPLAFKEKVDELLEQGEFDNRTDAENAVRGMDISLELYYHKDNGLFAIEEEVVGNGAVYSPYDATRCIEPIDE